MLWYIVIKSRTDFKGTIFHIDSCINYQVELHYLGDQEVDNSYRNCPAISLRVLYSRASRS